MTKRFRVFYYLDVDIPKKDGIDLQYIEHIVIEGIKNNILDGDDNVVKELGIDVKEIQ